MRKKTALQIANARLGRAVRYRDRYQSRIYYSFLSETAWKQKKRPVPEPAVTTVLGSKWCNYTGYCADPVYGYHLLRRLQQAARLVAARDAQRDEVLAARRAKADAKLAAAWAASDESEESVERVYVGTVPTDIYLQGQAAWREQLTARGRTVPPGLLVAFATRDNPDRYAVYGYQDSPVALSMAECWQRNRRRADRRRRAETPAPAPVAPTVRSIDEPWEVTP